MKRSFVGLVLGSCILVLLGAGCLGGSSSPTGPDGGVYRMDIGNSTWQQLKNLSLNGKMGSTGGLDIVSLAMDPQENTTLYAGSITNGLFYSLDNGLSWMQPKSTLVNTGRINAIAVSSKDKCMVYAARKNQILKTTNCLRDWSQVFFDPKIDKVFTSIAVDWFNPNTIYAGTSEGDVFRSLDAGGSWRVVQRVDGLRINNIAIDPHDSRTVYASTFGAGLLKSMDSGTTWNPIYKPFQDFDQARRVARVVIDPGVANTVYAISKYGILKSTDGGTTWKALTGLPNPTGTIDLRAFAVHPKNSKFLVYATDTSVVFSTDGGTTWAPRKLPTARGVATLLFDGSIPQPTLLLGPITRTQ